MHFTFIDMAGKTLFVRDDAERAEWTQEEMTLNADFPYLSNKHISTGQRVCFKDPSTGSQQIYEIKNAKTLEPDGTQQVVAENICISELSDCHLDNSEITNKRCSAALQGVLSGSLWAVGNCAVNPSSSVNISRGSVWQAVLQIADNWNVYIVPRVTLAANGAITRFLDVKSTDGEWNGLRLSIDKNFLDPSVTYDDSELVTALYGYGGSEPSTTAGEKPKEVNFSSVVWESTAAHPAKPAGQKYLEDKAATAQYGRNGRARFGYYQNSDITDPEILLQKTWETLKTVSKPSISIDGTIADLYRMGYADTPVKLHDIALIEVHPAGFTKQLQIIRISTDLLDPSATTVTIGAYIPNIIYINRNTNQQATGSRGGGGGNSNNDDSGSKWREFRTTINAFEDGTGLQIKAVQNDINDQSQEIAVQRGELTVLYNRITAEVEDRRDADRQLNAKLDIQASEIGLVVTVKDGKATVNAASIVAGINDQNGSYVKIKADKINLSGYVTATQLQATQAQIDNLMSGKSTATVLQAGSVKTGTLRVGDQLYVKMEKLIPDVGWIHYLGY